MKQISILIFLFVSSIVFGQTTDIRWERDSLKQRPYYGSKSRISNIGLGAGIGYSGGVVSNLDAFLNSFSLGLKFTNVNENTEDWYGTLGVKVFKKNLYLKSGYGSRKVYRNGEYESKEIGLVGLQWYIRPKKTPRFGFFKSSAKAPEVFISSESGLGFTYNIIF